ncbi:hypothetical protein BX257_4897 [Streptomyces sp. 3212.3]|nr:hypothetical protein ADL25_26905 [Streptomyces sp. NRRL F-5122]REE62281.1 hypothetical protein BX257_4897 [Streptomyces sp. 3212.3]
MARPATDGGTTGTAGYGRSPPSRAGAGLPGGKDEVPSRPQRGRAVSGGVGVMGLGGMEESLTSAMAAGTEVRRGSRTAPGGWVVCW